jgi:RHS repeat-associated protein
MGYQLDESWSRDAQGKWKITKMDALGRMVSVVEDPVVASGAGPIAGFSNTGTSPTLETSYLHDGRGNLTKVTQGVQVRDFVYDSVGRLSSASNPEMGSGASGQVLYGYFDSGSLKQKTEPGSVVTTLSYDRLNRLEAKSYSGAAVVTNSVSFCYDGNTAGNCAGAPTGANLLGRATMVVSGVYRTKMLAYDALGRVTQSAQKFAADPDLVFGYQYTQAGGVSEIQYPSGKRVASCFDGSGQAKEVKNGATNAAWVSGLQYEVNGAVKQATLGNGVIETRDYNSRWQARTVKAMQGATNLLELQYRYCPLEADACNTNNGNVISQRVVHSGLNALMGYEYDSLNRLKRAVDAANSFEQVFDYDRWGNRALTSGYRPYSGMTVAALAAYNAGKNQLNAQVELPPLGAYTAFQYDLRGNQLTQVGGRAYTFDAENRMVEAKTQGVTQGQYRYDGEGRRVEVIAGGKTTRFVYDAFGGLAAEYEVGVGSGAMETTYLVGDALGSTRLAMRPDGSLRRYEYAPFGEEIESGSFGRGAEYGESVGKPRVSQRFTSKERDAETGLDFFEARYMSAAQGRFTSPDEPLLDQTSADPQSWNLYSYVRNNPLIFTDPTGNDCVYTNSGGKGVGSVDNQIAAPQCGTSGGYWVDGTVTNARFAHGSLVLTGTIEGTNKTSASYGLGPDPGILALQKGTQLAEPGVKLAAIGLALGIGGPAAGAAYGAVAGGTALTQLAIYTLPVVTSAIDKLQKLGISIYEAGQIVGSPTAQRLIDTANGGNINVVQQVGEKLVRITTDPSGQRIISAGIIQARNINNSIASGRFIVK